MDGVPSALRALPWVGFRGELRDDGHWRKVPYQLGSPRDHASNSVEAHWRNEGDVREVQVMAPDLFHGFGVVLTADAGITFIDLDDVRAPDTGAIEAWALAMVDRFDSWAEISVSGTGVHIFARGTLPGSGLSNYLDGDPARKVEVYSTGRFACLTGRALDPVRPIAERQERLRRFRRAPKGEAHDHACANPHATRIERHALERHGRLPSVPEQPERVLVAPLHGTAQCMLDQTPALW
jgi:primase-polymerase (primpol)-like protein